MEIINIKPVPVFERFKRHFRKTWWILLSFACLIIISSDANFVFGGTIFLMLVLGIFIQHYVVRRDFIYQIVKNENTIIIKWLRNNTEKHVECDLSNIRLRYERYYGLYCLRFFVKKETKIVQHEIKEFDRELLKKIFLELTPDKKNRI